MTPTDPPNKSLMRNLGEFFGHIANGVRSDPTAPSTSGETTRNTTRKEVRRTVDEEQQGDVIYRRTTIDEIEVRPPTAPESAPPPDQSPDQPPDRLAD